MHRLGAQTQIQKKTFVLKTRAKIREIFDARTRVLNQTRVIERVESALHIFLRVYIN